MTNPFSLDDKIVLVTGASRGLGWETARAMAAAGARVVLNGRDPERLKARAAELERAGFEASIAPFDVSDHAAASAAFEEVKGRFGGLDVLVSNAGVVHRGSLDSLSLDDWQRVLDVDLTACFVLAREAARLMVARGSGRIIMMSSIMALIARPNIPAYVAAKGGLAALTRALAAELGPQGITCNAIAPGYITTEMTAELAANPEFDAFLKTHTPLRRWGRPEEIGSVAVFLASDAASYVNGHTLVVDGGLTTSL
ncbi:MAG: SDR family oxidoreductase [Alphaproteobacteria bacterium]